MPDLSELPPDEWIEWTESTLGGRFIGARREFTGGSRELWYVEINVDGRIKECVLRKEVSGGALDGSPFDLSHEIAAYRALAGTGLPVPAILGHRPDGLIMERAPGSSRLPADENLSILLLTDFMTHIARLHALPPMSISIAEAAEREIDVWSAMADANDPLLTFAFDWLRRHRPDDERRAVLVQGDTGPGNFVADGGRVSALIDWELSHPGDPMDDIAWIDQRCAALPPPWSDTSLRDRLYLEAHGTPIDAHRVAYWSVFVRVRCAVITDRTIRSGRGALGAILYEPPRHRFRVELATALCEASGTTPEWLAGNDITDDELGRLAEADLDLAALLAIVVEIRTRLRRPGWRAADKLAIRGELVTAEHELARRILGPMPSTPVASDDPLVRLHHAAQVEALAWRTPWSTSHPHLLVNRRPEFLGGSTPR